MISLVALPGSAAEALWPRLVPALEYGLKRWNLPDGRRRYTTDGVLQSVLAGGLELWEIHHSEEGRIGFLLMRVDRGAEYNTLFQWFTHVYKKPCNWRQGLGTALISLADTLGCDAVEGVGRKAWRYIFRETGARELYEMVCFQAVSNGRR